MAGHSKWSNIKHKKAKNDKAKSDLFSKRLQAIYVAISLGGPDPKTNSRLVVAIKRAKDEDISSDKIEKVLKSARERANALFPIQYEIYGKNGVCFLVNIMTDNKNRSISLIRQTLKSRGEIAPTGSVSCRFKYYSYIIVVETKNIEDDLLRISFNIPIEDYFIEDGEVKIFLEGILLDRMVALLTEFGYTIKEFEELHEPLLPVPKDEQNLALLNDLENLDGVTYVVHNMEQ